MDYIREYGLDAEEVSKWGEQNYPAFAKNLQLIAVLYLRKVKGIELKPKATISSPKKKVRDLKNGERVSLTLLVAAKIGERTYKGCPQCRRKINTNTCERCGLPATTLIWRTYIAGDETGDIILSIPPGVCDSELADTMIEADCVCKNGEVVANSINILTSAPSQSSQTKSEISAPTTATAAVRSDLVQVERDVNLFQKIMQIFKRLKLEEFEKWCIASKITTPREVLLERVGAVIEGDEIVLREKQC